MKYLYRTGILLLLALGVYRLMIVPLLEPVAASDISPGDDIVIFTTEWCGACDRARDYLTRNASSFRELDIEKSTSARDHYERLGGRGVPVAIIGVRRIDGFSASTYSQALRTLLEESSPIP